MNKLTEKTLEAFEKHGSIIVGVDFDDTIFPIDPSNKLRCDLIMENLKLLKKKFNATICLNTVAKPPEILYKVEIMRLNGLKPDYINESPIKKWGDCTKPYFNLYIDDKSGINEMIEVLVELNSD